MYYVTALLHNVHHIDSHNNRNAKFHQLSGEIQVSFNIRTIHDIDNRIRPFVNQIISGDYFLQSIRGKGINTWQIHDDHILGTIAPEVFFQLAFLFFHRNTGPVSHKLVGTGQRIE